MAVSVPGIISIAVFYLLILIIGIVIAARKTGFQIRKASILHTMMAGRDIGVLVGIFTMTATWVGGGYINGSTEIVATSGSGLVWCQAPLGFAVSLILGGLFFADTMRRSGFTTMLDPIHHKYGRLMGCLNYLPALSGEVFWSAAILSALGWHKKLDLLTIQLQTPSSWVGIPFAMTNQAARSITSNSDWVGVVETPHIGSFVDFYLLTILGGIPWQVYWQRALSARTVSVARGLSIFGGIGCIIMAVPAVLIGAVAFTADWNQTSYGHETLQDEDLSLALPLVFFHMTPVAVSFIGLGAVSAAVMSSTDSSILSASTMFSCNVFAVIYQVATGREPSEGLLVWVMRGTQVVIAAMACAMAISVSSIYSLFLLCADFVYVILFPQLLCVLYIRWSNSYGSLVGFVVGLTFRLLGGEPGLKLPAAIEYPWMDAGSQQFPFRTMSMLISLFCILTVSLLARALFLRHILPPYLDLFGCFRDDELRQGSQVMGEVSSGYVPESGRSYRVNSTSM